MSTLRALVATLFVALSLPANGGVDLIFADGFEPVAMPGEFSVGGTINAPGLTPTACVFCPVDDRGNGDFCLTIELNGVATEQTGDTEFLFDQELLNTGDSYEVTVVQSPLIGGAACSNPQQSTCSVSNGSGTIGTADVSNIQVSCN